VRLAGEVYDFVLSTAETVLKAIGWLLAKSGVMMKKLIDFAGFIFNWSDIMHTSDSISTLMSASLRYGEDKLESVNDAIKSWLDNIRDRVQSYMRRGSISEQKMLPRIDSAEEENIMSQANQLIKYGVSFNWVGDQLNHGDFLGLKLGTNTAPGKTSSP
jgi:hypothetical protein